MDGRLVHTGSERTQLVLHGLPGRCEQGDAPDQSHLIKPGVHHRLGHFQPKASGTWSHRWNPSAWSVATVWEAPARDYPPLQCWASEAISASDSTRLTKQCLVLVELAPAALLQRVTPWILPRRPKEDDNIASVIKASFMYFIEMNLLTCKYSNI